MSKEEIKQLVLRILDEYNHYHDPRTGRFAAGGASGGGMPDKMYAKHLALLKAHGKEPPVSKPKVSPAGANKVAPLADDAITRTLPTKVIGTTVINDREWKVHGNYKVGENISQETEGHHKNYIIYSSNGTKVYMDDRFEKGQARKRLDDLGRIEKMLPEGHNQYPNAIVFHKDLVNPDSVKVFKISNTGVGGNANYRTGAVNIYSPKGDPFTQVDIGGCIIHEIGHFASKKGDAYTKFRTELAKTTRDITSYGTNTNHVEAWAEAYKKFTIFGKVTSSEGKDFAEMTKIFKAAYPKKGSSLKETKEKESIGMKFSNSIRVQPIIKNKELVGEIFFRAKGVKE